MAIMNKGNKNWTMKIVFANQSLKLEDGATFDN